MVAERVVRHLSTPLVIVIGYSGSDVFDVAPMLAQLSEQDRPLRGTTVVWVAYAAGDLTLIHRWVVGGVG